MLSKSQIKLITSLHLKKYRNEHQLFIVEGKKTVEEFLKAGYKVKFLFATHNNDSFDQYEILEYVSDQEMKRISCLKHPSTILAVFEKRKPIPINEDGLILALDDVRDPGNLGTIIRLCDWFGITHLLCSEKTVDCYNPKVIQATMGSMTRVSIHYIDLAVYLNEYKGVVFGTFMEGNDIYQQKLPESGVVLMGNEANGISPILEELITTKLTIPRFGEIKQTESLNVAMATSIILSEFRR